MATAIMEVKCTSAIDLLNRLDSNHDFWGGKQHFWAFRGLENDDKYELIPSALRKSPEPELGYTFNIKKEIQANNRKQVYAEFERIHEFYWYADAQGLHNPAGNDLLRTPEGWKKIKEDIEESGWPIDGLLPLLALAQHYGVHTRLLDWSEKPLVAAYFAAKVACKETKPQYISVWGLNLEWIIKEAFPGDPGDPTKKLSVYVVTAPRASNPNLHAQGGVFTTEKITSKELKSNANVVPINNIVEHKWKEIGCKEEIMAHFRLPAEQSGKLLRLLNQKGINAATLFPGYRGIAESLKERSYWDMSERTSYWLAPLEK